MSLISSTPKPTRLSMRDIQLCLSLGQYKYLTTDQLRRLHFTTDNKTTVHNRMLQLRQAGFVSMRRIYTTDDQSERGAKTCVYFLRPENVRAVITHLALRGKSDLLGILRDLPTIDKHNEYFAHDPLVHEVGLSEVLLLLKQAAHLRGDAIPFFEQTSRAKYIQQHYDQTEISAEGKTRKRRVTFSPDGVLAYNNMAEKTVVLPFIEFDNATETLDTWRAKVTAILRFFASGKLPALIRHYSNKYNLGYSDTLCNALDSPILTIASSTYRMHQLLRETSRLPDFRQRQHFYFAALPDLSADTILGASWLNANDYRPIFDNEKQLPREMRPSVRVAWQTEQILRLPRVSFLKQSR